MFVPALELLQAKGVAASAVTYVGDSLVDFNAANAAGLKFVGVSTGVLSEQQLLAAGVGRVAPSIGSAIDLIMGDSAVSG